MSETERQREREMRGQGWTEERERGGEDNRVREREVERC